MARQWTDITIKNLPLPETGSKKLFDPSLPGFGIRLTAKSRTFIVQYGPDRKVRTIGKYPQISLREARKAALAILDAPQPKNASQSLTDALRAFLDDCETRLRPASVRFYRTQLSGYTTWPKTETNPHSIRALKVFANWCIDNGYRTDNPYLRLKAPQQARDRVLTDTEVAALWHYNHEPFATIIKLLLLTGQRRNQIISFEPSWVQGDELHFPARIMKSKREHVIPITGYGIYLQPFRFSSWSKSKDRLDRKTGVTDWVLHDCRRYFSSTMARLGVPLHITEQILDHRSTVSGVQAIYNRYQFIPEMREALIAYENHIANITSAQGTT